MRRAMNDMDLLTVERDGKETIIGINLGWDHVSEHEWGIDGMRRHLGIPGNEDPKNFGLKARTMTQFNEKEFFFNISKNWAILSLHGHSWSSQKYTEKEMLSWIGGGWYDKDKTPLVTAWSEDQFGIAIPSTNSAGVEFLKKFWEAFKKRDIAVWFGGRNNPFANNGLILCIASELPAEYDEAMRDADQARYQLLKDVEATGIEKRLQDAGLRYFALSPRRQEDGSLVFWLNPMEQDDNNACWCSVQDLDDWIAGKGKIPKQAKA